jgi:hypothetical protein
MRARRGLVVAGRSRGFGLRLAAGLAGMALAFATPPALASDEAAGLFVWTRRDAGVLASARAIDAGLRSAVHVATVTLQGGAIGWRRALTPAIDDGGRREAIVIRIDDSMHAIWTQAPDDVAGRLSPAIDAILAQSVSTGAVFDEVDLDYDAPDRMAAAWVRAAAVLARGSLRDRRVWITSIPTHLDAPGFAASLAEARLGHILQLFDTGLPCTYASYAHVADRLSAMRTPFRIGVGAFERAGHEGVHACWARMARGLRSTAGYDGTWIFPAGQRVEALLLSSESDEGTRP